MEGYYDGTIFHRIVKDFCIQGGDPTGTGEGGESVYGDSFADEYHSRLRFNHRGIVAMANSGPNSNRSQFFITLDRCDWLDRKHTIFGKVTGDTYYNVANMAELEVDSADRPEDPPVIDSTEVISNPYPDLEPRQLAQTAKAKKEGPVVSATKNKGLLSFGGEEEEEEDAMPLGMASSHDVLTKDKRLSQQAAVESIPNTGPLYECKEDRKRGRDRSLSSRDDEERSEDESRSTDTHGHKAPRTATQKAIHQLKREIRSMRPREDSDSDSDSDSEKPVQVIEGASDMYSMYATTAPRGKLAMRGSGIGQRAVSVVAGFGEGSGSQLNAVASAVAQHVAVGQLAKAVELAVDPTLNFAEQQRQRAKARRRLNQSHEDMLMEKMSRFKSNIAQKRATITKPRAPQRRIMDPASTILSNTASSTSTSTSSTPSTPTTTTLPPAQAPSEYKDTDAGEEEVNNTDYLTHSLKFTKDTSELLALKEQDDSLMTIDTREMPKEHVSSNVKGRRTRDGW
eukprot:gnl/Trimastix_PCT/3551.p1 GENE.gnl/Trimastix_PCT/3551~~gnl/Trimastix_PCT/3551.p1  ORF type:complete len:528 (-),score=72.39 gnl/Trimastix_PCT/3551:48-1580(-)